MTNLKLTELTRIELVILGPKPNALPLGYSSTVCQPFFQAGLRVTNLSLRSAPNQVGSRGAPPQLPTLAAEAEIRDKPALLSRCRQRLSSAGE